MLLKRLFLGFAFLFLLSCSSNDDGDQNVIRTINERDFVWKAMNLWYFWQEDVANLNDNIATQGDQQYIDFLNSYGSSEDLFEDLLYQFGTTDRFSSIFANKNDLNNALEGTSVSFGYEMGLAIYDDMDNIIMWVEYVVPGGPADVAGIQRGDLINTVNGTALNLDNYIDLLFGNTTLELGYADFVDGGYVSSGETVSLSAVSLTENPVFLSDVIEFGGKKIGYLVYNRFTSSFDANLNAAFGELIASGAQELVLDLRYNGGGSVRSAQYLASMITGQFKGERFADLRFNEKLGSQFNNSYDFVDQIAEIGTPINSMNLNTVYVLTSQETASASEMIINSLNPYIQVIKIGDTTVGKNVGQVPLYDSEDSLFTNLETATTDHNYALLPICFTYFNANEESNFSSGIDPDFELREVDFINDLQPLGSLSEPLLAKAIEMITGQVPPIAFPDSGAQLYKNNFQLIQLEDLDNAKLLGSGMYVESVSNQ